MGDDPARFVLALNVARRHLTPSQAAMAAAKIANLSNGSNRFEKKVGGSGDPPTPAKKKSGEPEAASKPPVSKPEAAKLLNVSHPSVKRASYVRTHGVPELVKAVEDGRIAVKPASNLAKLPPAKQRKALASGSKEVRQAVQSIQMVPKAKKREKRADMTPETSCSLLVLAPMLYYASAGGTARALSVMCGIGCGIEHRQANSACNRATLPFTNPATNTSPLT